MEIVTAPAILQK